MTLTYLPLSFRDGSKVSMLVLRGLPTWRAIGSCQPRDRHIFPLRGSRLNSLQPARYVAPLLAAGSDAYLPVTPVLRVTAYVSQRKTRDRKSTMSSNTTALV